MAEEDKTYCGREDRDHVDGRDSSLVSRLAKKLAITEQDVIDAMEQVGNDPAKVEAFFHDKENSY